MTRMLNRRRVTHYRAVITGGMWISNPVFGAEEKSQNEIQLRARLVHQKTGALFPDIRLFLALEKK